jgi:hypothetical protein
VSNRAEKVIVAYAVTFDLRLKGGDTLRRTAHFKYPDAVAGGVAGTPFPRGREIRPGEERAITVGTELRKDDDPNILTNYIATLPLGRLEHVAITLDAVVFHDGEEVGPDSTHLADRFLTYLDAKQCLYRSITSAVDSGASLASQLALVESTARRGAKELPTTPSDLYTIQAASDIYRLSVTSDTGTMLLQLRAATRPVPFKIWRNTAKGK